MRKSLINHSKIDIGNEWRETGHDRIGCWVLKDIQHEANVKEVIMLYIRYPMISAIHCMSITNQEQIQYIEDKDIDIMFDVFDECKSNHKDEV